MKILLTLCVLFFSSSVVAETYNTKGDEKCGFILQKEKEKHPKIQQKVSSWVQGYFTGRNYENSVQRGEDYDYDTLYFLVSIELEIILELKCLYSVSIENTEIRFLR